MEITVTRTFEPITRQVTGCRNCPYFSTERDMSMTLCVCEHPKFDNKVSDTSAYYKIIPDVTLWEEPKFSKHCPLV